MRLLFRTDPLPGESPAATSAVAHEHSYRSSLAGADPRIPPIGLTGTIPPNGLHVLRLDIEEWRELCYRNVKGRTHTSSVSRRTHQRWLKLQASTRLPTLPA